MCRIGMTFYTSGIFINLEWKNQEYQKKKKKKRNLQQIETGSVSPALVANSPPHNPPFKDTFNDPAKSLTFGIRAQSKDLVLAALAPYEQQPTLLAVPKSINQ